MRFALFLIMKAFIFDMDGVIFDSERAEYGIWMEMAEEHQLPGMQEVYYRCIGVNREVCKRTMLEAYGEDFPFEEYAKLSSKRYQERYGNGRLPIKEGARELLSYLSRRGYPIALASSTRTEKVQSQMKAADLLQYFNVVIGGDMVSKSKPDPEIFLKASEELSVAPEQCIVIEDSYNGIRAAAAAGMHPYMVPDMLSPNEEMISLCEKIVGSLTEMKEILMKEEP